MTKESKIGFSVIGILLASLIVGYFGGKWGADGSSGGGGGGGGGGTDIQTAAWINKIKKSGEIRIGCADSPPTTVVSSSGKCTGPDLIPMQDLADELGVKLKTVATTWQSIVAGLQAGRYDVAANLDQTVERGLAIQFSNPSWTYPGVYVVPKSGSLKTSAQVKAAAASKPVATSQGSALDAALQQAKIPELRVDTYENATAALQAGRASAVFTDLGTAETIVAKDHNYGIIVPKPAIFVHYVAYGLPSSIDPRSLQIVNIAIDNSVASGEVQRGFDQAGFKGQDNLGDMQVQE
jgi:polar amino acid transport system substrate-binding protein